MSEHLEEFEEILERLWKRAAVELLKKWSGATEEEVREEINNLAFKAWRGAANVLEPVGRESTPTTPPAKGRIVSGG